MLWLGLDYMNDVMDNSSQTDEDGNDSEQDERLTYRGIFQRLFIRPEIGALIGVVGLWVFFWAVTVPFGTAGGTASLVDFASTPLGIMAVAVSLLMVGGEFDLSAGAMTGAMGILVIMLSLEVGERGGAGLGWSSPHERLGRDAGDTPERGGHPNPNDKIVCNYQSR